MKRTNGQSALFGSYIYFQGNFDNSNNLIALNGLVPGYSNCNLI